MTRPRRVLIIERDADIRASLGSALAGEGWQSAGVATLAHAEALLAVERFEVMLIDWNIADGHAARLHAIGLPVVMMTAQLDLERRRDASLPDDVLALPEAHLQLVGVLERALRGRAGDQPSRRRSMASHSAARTDH